MRGFGEDEAACGTFVEAVDWVGRFAQTKSDFELFKDISQVIASAGIPVWGCRRAAALGN